MVEKKSKFNFVLPLLLSLIVVVMYRYLNLKLILAMTVGVIAFLLVMYDIKIGIYGATFIMPILPDKLGLVMMLSLALAYFVKNVLVEHKQIKASFFGAIIGVYLLVAIIGTVTSYSFSGSLRDLGLHIGGLCYVFVLVNTIETKEDLNTLLTILMVSATLIALYGILQYFTGIEIAREWVDVESSPDISARVYSVFGNPNIFSEYLVMLTPIGVGMMWQTKSIKKKPIFTLGVAAMLLAIPLTMARGSWVAIAFAALAFVLMVDRRLLLFAIPIVIAGVFLLPDAMMNRLLSIFNFADSSTVHRFKIYQQSFEVIRDNFLGGVGFGHMPFKEVFETYSRTINMYHTHNTYLQTIGELGIGGLMVFITMMFTFVKYPILKLVKRTDDTFYRYIGAGIVAGLAGMMMHGMFESILYIPRIIYTFWMVIGIMITMVNIAENDKDIALSSASMNQSVILKRGSKD